MMKLMAGGLGFSSDSSERDDELDQKIYRVATEAARRKFSPEFMNRIDNVIVFRTLQRSHLERILDIELSCVQERILGTASGRQFVFRCTHSARELLLEEGTDAKCGARHLKRAIERHLVFPLSNLMATEQVRLGDLVTVDYSASTSRMTFHKDEQGALEESLMGARATTARMTTSVGSAGA